MNANRIFLLVGALAVLFSCGRTTKESTTIQGNGIVAHKAPDIEKVKRVESYVTFYRKFHSDSLFQMSRIKFPIEGYYTDSAGIEQAWTKKSWIMHRSQIQNADTSIFKLELTNTNKQKEELLYIEGSGFKVERKFKQINGKWYLIYYVDENL